MKTVFWYTISNSFSFFDLLEIILIKLITIVLISAKFNTLGLSKRKAFQNKSYGIIIFVCDVTNNILSCEINYIADMDMWQKV